MQILQLIFTYILSNKTKPKLWHWKKKKKILQMKRPSMDHRFQLFNELNDEIEASY
jgi:hypothetical protein